MIGDSIRMSYQPLVAEQLKGKAEVWGPDENCRYSVWVLEHFKEWVCDQKPDILHFNVGIHDVNVMEDWRPRIILEQYLLCLQRFITYARDLGSQLIWASSTPFYQPKEDLPMSQWPKYAVIDRYNAAALEVVTANAIAIDDLHSIILNNDYTKCLQADGCHMTEFGREVLSEAVARSVSTYFSI